MRARDCALDAILTIIDGDAAGAYPARARWAPTTPLGQHDDALLGIRDEMIRELKQRLDGMAGKKR
jgi:hypothetical protein